MKKKMHHLSIAAVVAAVTLGLSACESDEKGPFDGPKGVDISGDPPELLSDMHLLAWNGKDVDYAKEVVPYDLNSPLFSDYAIKYRAIYIPEGKKAKYSATEVIDFPAGTVIVKTFAIAPDVRKPTENPRVIETRVLVRYEDHWEFYPYIWDEEGKDAVLDVSGKGFELDFKDEEGVARTAQYLVPSKNQCEQCHKLNADDGTTNNKPIGPKARHLNRDFEYEDGTHNQLEYLEERGLLEGLPPMAEVEDAFDWSSFDADQIDGMTWDEVNFATRSYLDINCGHCHRPEHPNGVSSRLWLNYDNTSEFNLGLCKQPGSAGKGTGGRTYDIVPGEPEQSVLWYRTQTEEVGSMMPLIGRSLEHTRAVALIEAWIAGYDHPPCSDQVP